MLCWGRTLYCSPAGMPVPISWASPSHGHPHLMGMAVSFPNPQGDSKEGFPGPPGRPGDPGDRVSFPREGKAGRSWPRW